MNVRNNALINPTNPLIKTKLTTDSLKNITMNNTGNIKIEVTILIILTI